MKTLACHHVGKVWASAGGLSVTALSDINLTVQQGEFIAILGPSGCGKSTLLELAAGLEPLSSGRITLDGKTVTGPEPGVVMVFQDHSLFPWLSVEDNVGFGLAMKHVPKPERQRRVREVLERVRLSRFAQHRPFQLSGGMKQRVAIARALVENADFIMMDEPFAALDFQTRVLMQHFLLEIWLEFRPTIIFVTHHIDEAVLLADRVVVMSAGPGRIIDDVRIDLPRPRKITDTAFNDYRTRLTVLLQDEVMRAYAIEEAAECPMRPDVVAETVAFADLFTALGTADMTYGDGARDRHGRHVVIAGFLSHAHGSDRTVSLVSEPGVCADCSAVPVPVIALPDLRAVPREGDGVVRIAGRLDFGLRIVGGTASMLRIENAIIIETADAA